ncbi:Flavoredoxin [compost metagenome]
MRKLVQSNLMHAYPGRVSIVTSKHADNYNMMAAGYNTYVGSDPEVYGISIRKETRSYELIKNSGFFGVNFLSSEYSHWIQGIGTMNGYHIDKFQQLGISFEDGFSTSVPILDKAYFAYECKVIDERTYGDHQWIAGEIVQTYADEELFDENGLPIFEKLSMPLYVGRSLYRLVDHTSKIKVHDEHLKGESQK